MREGFSQVESVEKGKVKGTTDIEKLFFEMEKVNCPKKKQAVARRKKDPVAVQSGGKKG